MLENSTCVEYGRNGIYFIINLCMLVQSIHNLEVGAVSIIQMQPAQQRFLWQYTTVRLFMCIVLRMVILCRYCVVCVSGVLTLWINSQLSVISYTLFCHMCYIWILQTASNSGMYMFSTNIHEEVMKLMSSHPHIHSRLNFTISDTKWFYVFKLLNVLLGIYMTEEFQWYLRVVYLWF